MMSSKPYETIIRFAESFLEKYGDNYLGVGWTKSQEDADARYRVMLDVIQGSAGETITLLDFGCGASHLYEYIRSHEIQHVDYSGLDLSRKFLALSRAKFPSIRYYDLDVLDKPDSLPPFDYIVMNGIFTTKCELSSAEMWEYFKAVLERVFAKARKGLAFNVMSKQVDWERDDLFHVPMDELGTFVTTNLSRHFVMRHDYGLYEYTVYVYRDPRR